MPPHPAKTETAARIASPEPFPGTTCSGESPTEAASAARSLREPNSG